MGVLQRVDWEWLHRADRFKILLLILGAVMASNSFKVSDVEVILTSYADRASDIFFIRQQVFHLEQNIDPVLDMDGEDETADHFIAYWQQQPVGIARIRAYEDGTQAKIERVAVLQAFRQQGIGKAITISALQYAQQQGFATAILYAQTPSASFYEQFGFQRQGEPFIQADMLHIAMVKNLAETPSRC